MMAISVWEVINEMKTNIYIKSILRQPIRTLLLFLLIGLASYAFVLRAVEYITISQHIDNIAANYRTIGFLLRDTPYADVSEGAQILANSPDVGFEDRRRQIEAIAHDLHSPDTFGMTPGLPVEDQLRFSVTYFYGTFTGYNVNQIANGIIWILISVEDVLVGQPQHIIPRQQISLRFTFDVNDSDSLIPFEQLHVGNRYLFKSHYYLRFFDGSYDIPHAGRNDWMDWQPISDDLWAVPASQNIDFSAHSPSLAHVPEHIQMLDHNQRALTVNTTIDMSAMPDMQGRGSAMRLARGRLLNLDDYHNANPVAVIHAAFAHMHGLNIGDILTLTVHEHQYVAGHITGSWVGGGMTLTDVFVRSTPDATTAHIIELEIVGTYNNFVSYGRNFGWGIIYVPDSVIPGHISVGPPARDMGLRVDWQYGHVPGVWYSFILESTRREQGFMLEYRDVFSAMGLTLVMFQAGAGNFWAAADPILLIVTFNAIVFSVVLFMVLTLVSFLYLRQRRRDFAIMRALGRPIWQLALQLGMSVLLLSVPAAAIGGALAWRFALAESQAILQPFAELAVNESIRIFDPFNRIDAAAAVRATAEIDMSIMWLVGFVSLVIALLLIMIYIGYALSLRHSVLEQLQGNTSSANKPSKRQKVVSGDISAPVFVSSVHLPNLSDHVMTQKGKFKGSTRWIFTHIARSAVKTALGFLIAVFFVFALGWLQESIRGTETQIDYLYANTIVRVEVAPVLAPGARSTGVITRQGVMSLSQSQYVDRIAAEAAHMFSAIVPPLYDGTAPYDWDEVIGFDRNMGTGYNLNRGAFNTLLAVSDLEEFIAEHYVGLVGDVGADTVSRMQINFMEGFRFEDFYFDTNGVERPIPIIIPQRMADERNLKPGDTVFLAYSLLNGLFHNFRMTPALVVGVHNEYILRPGHNSAAIIPISALESLGGWLTLYTNLTVTINTDYNREMPEVRQEVTGILSSVTAFVRPIDVFFMDEELRIVAGAMGQVLLLLELMYPIAIALAVAIGAAMSMLLVLQAAKNAAIMRVLGATRQKTCVMLATELIAICFIGIVIGLSVLIALAWGFGIPELIIVAMYYFGGAIAGSVAGAIVVTAKQPLELLQVRE